MKEIAFAMLFTGSVVLGTAYALYRPAPKVVEVERVYYSCAPSYETRIPKEYEIVILGRGE